MPESLYRDWRVKKLLPDAQIGIDDVKRALADDFGTPFAVCRPPFDPDAGSLSATVATIIMEPGQRGMEIAPMPAEGTSYKRYSL